jgi:glutaredoxin 3
LITGLSPHKPPVSKTFFSSASINFSTALVNNYFNDNLEKILIDRDPAQRELMMTRTGRRTVPQIYIGETHVGGYDDLVAWDRAGKLDPLLM